MVTLRNLAAAAAAAASPVIPGGSRSTGTVSSTPAGVTGTGTDATGNLRRLHAREWPQAKLSGSDVPKIDIPTKSSRQPIIGNTANGERPFVTITPTVRDPSGVGRSSTSSPSNRSTDKKPLATSASHHPQPEFVKSQANNAIRAISSGAVSNNDKAKRLSSTSNTSAPPEVKSSGKVKDNTVFRLIALRGKRLPKTSTSEVAGDVIEVHLSDGSIVRGFKRRDVKSAAVPVTTEVCPDDQEERLDWFEGQFKCMTKNTYTGKIIFGTPIATASILVLELLGVVAAIAGTALTGVGVWIVGWVVYEGVLCCFPRSKSKPVNQGIPLANLRQDTQPQWWRKALQKPFAKRR